MSMILRHHTCNLANDNRIHINDLRRALTLVNYGVQTTLSTYGPSMPPILVEYLLLLGLLSFAPIGTYTTHL
jgi:hypothetical protein